MAEVRKINPVGLDKKIDRFQHYLYTKLGWVEYESFPRVYLNPRHRGTIAETYTGNGEYEDVLFTDKFNATSFFLKDDREVINDEGLIEVDVSLIVQAHLVSLYAGILHRPDEELKNDIVFHSNNYSGYEEFRLKEVLTRAQNVYREVDADLIQADDMSYNHFVRFVYSVKYTESCCSNC